MDDREAMRAFLEGEARRIGESLSQFHPKKAEVVKVEGPRLSLTITVIPGGSKAVGRLSPCQRDVMAILGKASTRMTGPEIMDAIIRAGIHWSEVTVWRALSGLVRQGYIASHKRSPQGYEVLANPMPTQNTA